MKESQYKSRPSFTFAWLGLVDWWRLLFSSSAEQMFTEDILVFLLPELPLFTCWSQLTFFWLIQDSWQFGHKYRKLAKASEIFHKVLSFTPEAKKRKGKIRKKRGKKGGLFWFCYRGPLHNASLISVIASFSSFLFLKNMYGHLCIMWVQRNLLTHQNLLEILNRNSVAFCLEFLTCHLWMAMLSWYNYDH